MSQRKNNETKTASKDAIKILHLKLSSCPFLASWLAEARIYAGSASVTTFGEFRADVLGWWCQEREVCKTINTPHPDKNCLIIPCREDGWKKIDKLHPADRFVPQEALQPKQHPPLPITWPACTWVHSAKRKRI